MNRMNWMYFALASLLVPASVWADTTSRDSRFRAAEAILDAQLTRESVPGAAFGIVHDQELIWSYNYGVESLATKAPVTDDTQFSICSISKVFNGVAAMNLVESGAMGLDTPLADYLDGLEIADTTGGEEPVTVRGILTHASGLPREGATDYWADNSFPDADGLVDTVQMQTRLYPSYDYWQYSNLGMAMLGQAVANVAEMSWGSYISQTILQPLGMERTTTDMPFDNVGRGFAQGYLVRNSQGERQVVEPHQFRAFAPAAGVASTVNDLARFAAWHFRLQAQGGEEVLKATTQKNMLRVHWMGADFEPPAWGLAYATRRYGDKTLWGHGGYCPGTRAEFVLRLPDKLSVIAMTTANDVAPGAMARWLFQLTSQQIVDSAEEGDDAQTTDAESEGPNLADYEGYYYVAGYDWDSYIGIDGDNLFAASVYAEDPTDNMQTWVHQDGDVFRRERDNGELAETVEFERDENGQVKSVVQHSYRMTKRVQ